MRLLGCARKKGGVRASGFTFQCLGSSCASIFTAGMTFVAAPAFTYTCATVTFTPLGLWVRKIANMSYEMSRGESGLTEAP